jgi:hypothetical protein
MSRFDWAMVIGMAVDDDSEAARCLAGQTHEVGRASGREPWREALRWISRGRLGRRIGWPVVPRLNTPWQDTISAEWTGWRQRAANLHDEYAFAVDYLICRRCGLGWVEQLYTLERYQRCGLATAGLAAHRADYPGLAWHTLYCHFRRSQPPPPIGPPTPPTSADVVRPRSYQLDRQLTHVPCQYPNGTGCERLLR